MGSQFVIGEDTQNCYLNTPAKKKSVHQNAFRSSFNFSDGLDNSDQKPTIKRGRGRPKGTTKKKAAKKKAIGAKIKKAATKKPTKKLPKKSRDELLDEIELGFDDGLPDLENMNTDELNDENIKAMIRARTAQAKKQERLNAVAQSSLVEKEMATNKMVNLCQRFVDRLNNVPDKLTPQLHKRTKSEIRKKMIMEFDELKASFVEFINEGI